MKKIFTIRIPLIAALLLLMFAITSCDDKEEGSDKVELLSFGPSNVLHGEEISIRGNNLNKVTAVVLPIDVEVTPDQFKKHTKTEIVFDVPMETGYGKVILRTPQGDIESKSIYSPEAPIEITSFTEEAKPGTDITIEGEFLNFVYEVWFADGQVVTEFVSQEPGVLVVTVPMAAQTGSIVLVRAPVGPEGLSVETETDLTVTLPTFTSMSPGSVKHLEELTITGTDLDLITEVVFGGNVPQSTFVSQSETEIVLQVPVGALTGALTLKQVSPISLTTNSLTVPLPKGTLLAPKPATPGTDNITITGTELDQVAELTLVGVASPILATNFLSQSPTQIVVALPAEAINGTVVYSTVHGYSASLGVSVLIPTPGPPPLDYYIYDDGLMNGWSKWDGWGTTAQDFANAEEVFEGTTAIKVTYNNQWGALQLGAPSAGVFSGYTTLSFRINAPSAQNFIIQINEGADKGFSIPAGWSEVNIPISELDGNASVTELRFKNNNASLPVTLYIDYVGLKL